MNRAAPASAVGGSRRRLPAIALVLAALAAVLLAPSLLGWWRERAAIRAFQTDLVAIEIARQDHLLKGVSPIDKGRTPAHDLALQRWEFAETHALVRRHRAAAPPGFGKYLALLDGVYDRTLRFGARVARLDELRIGLARLKLHEVADPARNAQAVRDAAEARHISSGLRDELVAHHEHARGAIAGSGLDERSRAAVWRVADQAYVAQLGVVATVERWGPELGRLEELLRFFADNREGYEVDPQRGLVFRNPSTELRFMQLMRRLDAAARG